MKRRLLLTAGLASLAAPSLANIRQRPLVLSTGTTGGTYYPIGVGLAQLVNAQRVPRKRRRLAAISSAGSIENLDRLQFGDCDMAICQGLFARKAFERTGQFNDFAPQKDIVSLGALWPNVEHFVMRSGLSSQSDLRALADKDVSINLGSPGSGALGSGQFLLESLGFEFERRDGLYYDGYSDAVTALISGSVDLINLPGGVPVPAVTRAFKLSRGGVQVASVSPSDVIRADAGLDLWQPVTLPAGSYPGQRQPIRTMAQPNVLLGRSDMDDSDVTMVLRGLYAHTRYLINVHAAAAGIQLQRATLGLSFPLHPAAARFYAEQGATMPRS